MTVIRAIAILSNALRTVEREGREARRQGLLIDNPYRKGWARLDLETAISDLADAWDAGYNAIEQDRNEGGYRRPLNNRGTK